MCQINLMMFLYNILTPCLVSYIKSCSTKYVQVNYEFDDSVAGIFGGNIIRCSMVSAEDQRPQMTSGLHWIVVRLYYIPRFRNRHHALHNRARLLYAERKIEIAATVAKCVLAVRHNPNIQTRRVFVIFFSLPSSN